MEQTPIQLKAWQLIAIAGIFGLIVGTLLGLIPLIVGRKKNKLKLGNWGFLVCILTGIVGSWLAVIPAIVFTILILRQKTVVSPDADNIVI